MIDYRTGEITEPTKALATVDKSSVSVVSMLEKAEVWLATAVDVTGPAEIAQAKAQIVTAETYARELHLSKDIQRHAAEIRRRVEYALGAAIRKGQEQGEVASKGQRLNRGLPDAKTSTLDYLPNGQEQTDILHLADNADLGQFEAALEAAKAEGDLSRANVVRKVKQKSGPTTRSQRADLIEELAKQGYSTRQMPAKVGVTEETIRKIARDLGIEIPADKTFSKARRIDSNRIVNETCSALAGLAMGVDLIDYEALDPAQKADWADSLSESLSTLNALHRRINKETKESTQ